MGANPEKVTQTATKPKPAAGWYAELVSSINLAIFSGEDFRNDGMRIIRAIQAQARNDERKRLTRQG